jgi:hypothetical protein
MRHFVCQLNRNSEREGVVMGGKSPLKIGAPRVFGNHLSRDGRRYSRAYADLEAAFGPFTSSHVKFEAARVAVLRLQWEHWTEELAAAQGKRRTGRGRRPNERQVERLARRQGLADQSYGTAIGRFEDLMKRTNRQDAKSPLLIDEDEDHG